MKILTDDREIDFAVAGRRLLEIDSAPIEAGVALADGLEAQLGRFGSVEEGRSSAEARVLPVHSLLQSRTSSQVEAAIINFFKVFSPTGSLVFNPAGHLITHELIGRIRAKWRYTRYRAPLFFSGVSTSGRRNGRKRSGRKCPRVCDSALWIVAFNYTQPRTATAINYL